MKIKSPFKEQYDRERVARGLAMKAGLEAYYRNEENFCVVKVSDNEAAAFPDGASWARCTSWAVYVRRLEGERAKLYGFDSDENPDSEIADRCGGHDFAFVDERYIVDGWVVNVEGMSKQAVFDIYDPADIPEIHRLYGDPVIWLEKYQAAGHEQLIDMETAEERALAMKGVTPRIRER